MTKSMRFLGKWYGQIALCILGFLVVILAGLLISGKQDNLFGTYFFMFPLLCIVITGITAITMSPYVNIALSMNGSRSSLFGATQVYIILLSILTPLATWLLQFLGEQLLHTTPWLTDFPMAFLILLTALVLGELSLLISTLEGKLRTVIYTVVFILYIIFCGMLGAFSAMADDRAFPIVLPEGLFLPLNLVLLVFCGVLAAVNWNSMRKAVVRV